jgi:tRNA pseudouridine32 synthase/23S rRNA pseudouridine746 synthase
LSFLSRRIAEIDVDGARLELEQALRPFDARIAEIEALRRVDRETRRRLRADLARSAPSDEREARLADLDASSRKERQTLRLLRRERDAAVASHRARLDRVLAAQRTLRRERKQRSRALQAAMHDAHGLLNFAGGYVPLRELFGARGIPSGAGDCCAPKLLHAAALAGIRPRGMAEIWCGPPPPDGSKRPGQLCQACDEKCGPLLGYLLCGADDPRSGLSTIYEDADLLVVDKPTGLLSVPGRSSATRDCVQMRLCLLRPEDSYLRAVHRLDQGTSGLLVLARNPQACATLSRSFAEGRVRKTYEAIVGNVVDADCGLIDLPIRPDHELRPRQVVDYRFGKPARTHYEVRSRSERTTHLVLSPVTGRTHQLRLHCASPHGLGAPILGDPLYGDGSTALRLMLHSVRLELPHPRSGRTVVFESAAPFAGK